jgi:hypothetical protein
MALAIKEQKLLCQLQLNALHHHLANTSAIYMIPPGTTPGTVPATTVFQGVLG